MNHAAGRSIIGLTIGVLLGASGCGKSSSPGTGGGGSSGNGGNTGNVTSCSTSALKIVFNPMYTAFDGVHNFKIPAVVDGLDPSIITWSASDPSMVAIATDDSTGGAMITAQKAGLVTIIASAGTLCGTSPLTITAASADDWEAGSARYNDGVTITRVPGGRPGGNPDAAATDAATPQQAACTNCHGDTATVLQYKTVQHTPEQAGGFSDDDLKNIFLHGMVPTGGYFDTMIVPYNIWQTFHKWQMTDDEAKGIIVYLRSLAPTMQTGTGNFGGRVDGGIFDRPPRGDGGMGRRDGNGNPDRTNGGSGGASGDDAAAETSAD